MLSRGPHYWTDADLLFCPQSVSEGQMGWGDRKESLGGITDPPPLRIFCTTNMPHAPWSDPSSSLTEAHLPSSPPAAKKQQGMLPCQMCQTEHTTAPWSLDKFYSFRLVKLWQILLGEMSKRLQGEGNMALPWVATAACFQTFTLLHMHISSDTMRIFNVWYVPIR